MMSPEGKLVVTPFMDPQAPQNIRAALSASQERSKAAAKKGAAVLVETIGGW